MKVPHEFFTIQSFGTLAGASSITYFVCNGLQKAFNFNPKWLALIVAIAISSFGVFLAGEKDLTDYIIGLLNGFLIYATAAGSTEITGKGAKRTQHADGVYNISDDSNSYSKDLFFHLGLSNTNILA